MRDVAQMSPSIVLFDLGNVVVNWRPVKLYTDYFGDAEKARWFCDNIATMAWHVEHDRGVSFAENAARLISKFPDHQDAIKLWRSRWLDMFEGYVPGVPTIMAELEEKQVPLYGLSNLSAEIADETFDRYPMIKILRDIIVSGAEGVVKPDPKIYEITLERLGNPDPSDVFFTDDSLPNIEAAGAMGFETHHFEGAAGLRLALVEHGLL